MSRSICSSKKVTVVFASCLAAFLPSFALSHEAGDLIFRVGVIPPESSRGFK